MRRPGIVAIGLLTVALLSGLGEAPAARAESQDVATGVVASVSGAQLRLDWSRAPRDLTTQGIEWHLSSDESTRTGMDVDAAATTATVDLSSPEFLGGRSYAFAVVSLFRDGAGPEQRSLSEEVVVTVPERAPRMNPPAPACHVDQKHLRLTVKVPTATSTARGERFTVTGRTLEVLQDDRLFITRSLPGRAAARTTFRLSYWSTKKPRMSGVAYTVRYRLNTPAGSSFNSLECHTGLAAPQPKRFALSSRMSGNRIITTWAKAQSPVLPVSKYEIRWEVGTKSHKRFATAKTSRTLSLPVGNAKRVSVDVFESNALGGRTYNGVVWFKHGTRWTSYITYHVG